MFVTRRRLNVGVWLANAGFTHRDDLSSWCEANGIEDPGAEIIPMSYFDRHRVGSSPEPIVHRSDTSTPVIEDVLDLSVDISTSQAHQGTDSKRAKKPRQVKVHREHDVEPVAASGDAEQTDVTS